MTFNKKYLILAILLFVTEVLIALFVHDRFVRPYVGDVLVVMLIYCFVRTFFNSSPVPTALAVLVFTFIIEFLQYAKIVEVLGVQHNVIARTVIGTSYSSRDLIAYSVGCAITIIAEASWRTRPKTAARTSETKSFRS